MKSPLTKLQAKSKSIGRQPKTVSRSSPVYNYRSSRSESTRQYNRGDEPKEKKWLNRRKYIKFILPSAVFLSMIYLLVLVPEAEVKLSGEATITRPDKSYEFKINQYLGQSISSYTKLTFNQDKLASQLKADFPEISDVKVSIPLFSRQPKVGVQFAEPAVLLRVFGDDTYILDSQGRALVRQSEVSKGINLNSLIIVNDTSSQKIELNKILLTQQQINFIIEVVRQSEARKISPESINLAGGASQLNVKYKDADYFVKYSFFSDARQSSGAYFTIRDQLEQDNKIPREYIDLRIPERVYIK